ncbi:hypothetical protein WJX79_001676 [Trebouxia sp. C0005]
MLALAGRLDKERYKPRCYVVGQTDALGPAKAAAAEQSLSTHITASYAAVGVVWVEAPDLVLVNGPGTCIPICLAVFLVRMLGRNCRVVYVESIARIPTQHLCWARFLTQQRSDTPLSALEVHPDGTVQFNLQELSTHSPSAQTSGTGQESDSRVLGMQESVSRLHKAVEHFGQTHGGVDVQYLYSRTAVQHMWLEETCDPLYTCYSWCRKQTSLNEVLHMFDKL